MLLALLSILLLFFVGFACGYGVRELIARRRRATARAKFYEDNPELRRLRGREASATQRRFCYCWSGNGVAIRLRHGKPRRVSSSRRRVGAILGYKNVEGSINDGTATLVLIPILHDETVVMVLDDPWRREAAGGHARPTRKRPGCVCGPGLPVMAGAQTETGCILRNVELLSKDCANRGKAWRIPPAKALRGIAATAVPRRISATFKIPLSTKMDNRRWLGSCLSTRVRRGSGAEN